MNIEEYEEALVEALNKLFAEYGNRIRNIPKKEHNHITNAAKIIGVGATVGGIVGTAIPIPIAGNAIGIGGGVAIAAGIIGIIEAYNTREDKKLNNANKVVDFLGNNKEEREGLIKRAANKVINDRKYMLLTLKDTEKNKKSVAGYLAANMMAAIKYNNRITDGKVNIIINGIQEARSKKISSRNLKTENGEELTLKELAQLRLRPRK